MRPSAGRILVLSGVHPDFLAPLYSLSMVLRDESHVIDVLCFESPAPHGFNGDDAVRITLCGAHNGGFWERVRDRRRLRATAARVIRENRPLVMIAACPLSFLLALDLADGRIPVIYYAFECHDASWRHFLRAPATCLRNWRAFGRLRDAALVCTPSFERSGWLVARGRLPVLPSTVLNAPSVAQGLGTTTNDQLARSLLPESIFGRSIVLYTGRVSDTHATAELLESVSEWPREAALVVTNVGTTGYAAEVRRIADRSPRRADIVLLPLLPRQSLLALQAEASVGVILLRRTAGQETIMPAPNKAGEYLHAGLMLVGNRMPYLEALEERGLAVLSASLTPQDLAAATTEALTRAHDPQVREAVRHAARTWYSMEWQARPIVSLVRRLRQEVVEL